MALFTKARTAATAVTASVRVHNRNEVMTGRE